MFFFQISDNSFQAILCKTQSIEFQCLANILVRIERIEAILVAEYGVASLIAAKLHFSVLCCIDSFRMNRNFR